MRKNRLFILGIFTVMVALVSLSLVSGTWAKYTSTAEGTDTAKVAKWDVKFEGSTATSAAAIEVDLFDTITNVDGSAEQNVKAEGNLIAPGTAGQFTFNMKNESEVTAAYYVDYTYTGNLPLEFSLTGADDSWTKDINTLDIAEASKVTMAMDSAEVAITVYWRWVFHVDAAGDTADTNLGLNLETGKVDAKFTFVQVD